MSGFIPWLAFANPNLSKILYPTLLASPVYRKRLHLTHKIDLVTCRTLDFSEIGPFKLRYLFYTQTLPRGLLKIFVVQFLF